MEAEILSRSFIPLHVKYTYVSSDRSETYFVPSSWAFGTWYECYKNPCIWRRDKSREECIPLQVKCPWFMTDRNETYVAFAEYTWSTRHEFSWKSLQWKQRYRREGTLLSGYCTFRYWSIVNKLISFLASMSEIISTNFHEVSYNWSRVTLLNFQIWPITKFSPN